MTGLMPRTNSPRHCERRGAIQEPRGQSWIASLARAPGNDGVDVANKLSASLRAKRSNPGAPRNALDCFVATAPRNDGRGFRSQLHTGSAIEYFTWLSAKLDSIEAMPSSRVSLFFRNAS